MRRSGSCITGWRGGWRNSADATVPSAPFTIFIHVPKTAGTSLKLAMIEGYGPRLAWFAHFIDAHTERTGVDHFTTLSPPGVDLRTRYALLGGHMHYSEIPEALRRDALVAAVIREPVARALSFYAYARGPHGGRLGELIAGRTLDAALDVPEFAHVISNQQCRFLFGSPAQRQTVFEESGQRYLIGKAEAMEAFLAAFARHAELPLPPLKRVNVSDSTFADDIARQGSFDEACARIRKLAQADVALYESFGDVMLSPALAQRAIKSDRT